MIAPLKRMENSWNVYADIQRHIRYADRKIQILLAIGLAVLSFSVSQFDRFIEIIPAVRLFCTLTLLAFSTFFIVSVLLALFARGAYVNSDDTTPHFIFFGHIVQYRDAEIFAEKASRATAKEQLDDLHQQIYQISHIAAQKYRYYQRAWIALLGIFISLAVLIIATLF